MTAREKLGAALNSVYALLCQGARVCLTDTYTTSVVRAEQPEGESDSGIMVPVQSCITRSCRQAQRPDKCVVVQVFGEYTHACDAISDDMNSAS